VNVPDRYGQLVNATSQDRERLRKLDDEIVLRVRVLAEGPAGLEALEAQRLTLAKDIEVSEAMLAHAQRTYDIPGPGVAAPIPQAPNPSTSDPALTQGNPVLNVGGTQVEAVNPEGKPGLPQMLNIRRPRQAPVVGEEATHV
jgi:Tfp pilus assembly protein FimV